MRASLYLHSPSPPDHFQAFGRRPLPVVPPCLPPLPLYTHSAVWWNNPRPVPLRSFALSIRGLLYRHDGGVGGVMSLLRSRALSLLWLGGRTYCPASPCLTSPHRASHSPSEPLHNPLPLPSAPP